MASSATAINGDVKFALTSGSLVSKHFETRDWGKSRRLSRHVRGLAPMSSCMYFITQNGQALLSLALICFAVSRRPDRPIQQRCLSQSHALTDCRKADLQVMLLLRHRPLVLDIDTNLWTVSQAQVQCSLLGGLTKLA